VSWVADNLGLLLDTLLQHVLLTIPPIALTLVLAVPVVWLADRSRLVAGPITTLSALMYSVPSLPLFLLIPVAIGTPLRSPINVDIALTLYGLALLVPTTVAAVRTAPDTIVDAATGVGLAGPRLFWQVKLPLAGPAMLAGLRVVSASTISLATLGSILGIAGLGRLFTDGFQRGLTAEIAAGIVLTVALALVVDAVLLALAWLAMPWTRGT
jgi:osmoprotectant transport system permease protein